MSGGDRSGVEPEVPSQLGPGIVGPPNLAPGTDPPSVWVWDGTVWQERRAGYTARLALLSDIYNNANWVANTWIGLNSVCQTNSSYSFDFVAGYVCETEQEQVSRWTFSSAGYYGGALADYDIQVWQFSLSGGSYFDTGIRITVPTGARIAQQIAPGSELILNRGDRLAFVAEANQNDIWFAIDAHVLPLT